MFLLTSIALGVWGVVLPVLIILAAIVVCMVCIGVLYVILEEIFGL